MSRCSESIVDAGTRMKEARFEAVVSHSLALATASLLSYWLATHALSGVHSLSRADDLLGGLWAVLATLFVYRESHRQSMAAAFSRASATLVSFVLCLVYLLVFSFHPLGLAVLIGVGTFLLMGIGREEDVVTAGITTAVVLVAAALSPCDAWEQPILRLADTAVGIAVGVGAAWVTCKLAARARHARLTRGGEATHASP